MEIAAAHFDFSVKEKEMKGHFNAENKLDIECPKMWNMSIPG